MNVTRSALCLLLLTPMACGGEGDETTETPTPTATQGAAITDADKQAVVDNYAMMVFTHYEDVYEGCETMDAALNAFVASPSADTLAAAKQAWLDVRDIYGQTEVYRFYDGPIDDADGPEGLINAWPMDESYIDYTQVSAESEKLNTGIINNTETYPDITAQLLIERNEAEEEDTISTGFHAIEFLLWGQDFYDEGPGQRPYQDFIVDDEAGFGNADRRAEYLLVASDILLENIDYLVQAWDPSSSDNYYAAFTSANPDESLQKMLRGMGALSAGELAGERMYTAYETKEQEDEHSCFSDNTVADIYANALGIDNVYYGRYAEIDGPGIDSLIEAVDDSVATEMAASLTSSLDAIQAIPGPFDQAISGSDDAPGRQAVLTAVTALNEQGDVIVDIAAAFGLTISISV